MVQSDAGGAVSSANEDRGATGAAKVAPVVNVNSRRVKVFFVAFLPESSNEAKSIRFLVSQTLRC